MSPLVAFTEKDYQEQIDDIKKNEEAAANALTAAQEALRNIEPQRDRGEKAARRRDRRRPPLLTEKYQALAAHAAKTLRTKSIRKSSGSSNWPNCGCMGPAVSTCVGSSRSDRYRGHLRN